MTISQVAPRVFRGFARRLSHYFFPFAALAYWLASDLSPGVRPAYLRFVAEFPRFFTSPLISLLIDRENYGYPFSDVLTNN
jgi:hypothetical protein